MKAEHVRALVWLSLAIAGLGLLLVSKLPEKEWRLVRAVDGDTIDVTDGYRVERVRMRLVDAPESDQPYGEEARELVEKLIGNKAIALAGWDRDEYGRLLSSPVVNGVKVEHVLLERGLAWSYYRDDVALMNKEEQSRRAGRGLWKAKNPVKPSQWRKNNKN